MPVPTQTFWNIKKLNVIFAASAVFLMASFGLLIKEDQNVLWRGYQKDSRVWVTAMTQESIGGALSDADKAELKKIESDIAAISAEIGPKLKELTTAKEVIQGNINKKTLPAAMVKGEITPLMQLVEKAVLAHGQDAPETQALLAKFNKLRADSEAKEAELVRLDQELAAADAAIAAENARLTELTRAKDAKLRDLNTLKDRLSKNRFTGAAALGEELRNAPLLDWFNPSLGVQQVVVPDVRTDLNFLTSETVDRCNSCHINIDNPKFDEREMVSYAERQLAGATLEAGQTIAAFSPHEPVVMLGFWVNAAKARIATDEHGKPTLQKGLDALTAAAVERVNALRASAGVEGALAQDADVVAELDAISKGKGIKAGTVTFAQWYEPVAYFSADLKALLKKELTKTEYKSLRDMYRHELLSAYNVIRKEQGLTQLPTNPVQLAHPHLELYAEAESKHPMKSMGCTVCHEGSGQETIFEHTAHMPRDIWVDAKTGSPIPDFFIKPETKPQSPKHAALNISLDGAQPAYASASGDDGHGHDASHHAGYTFDDLNLADPHSAKPFAPDPGHKPESAVYVSPVSADGEPLKAVRQQSYWEKSYKWAHVHYMHWEKPMNTLDYVESSCIKCHTQVFDLKETAPRLYEGRKLFSQFGCVNCHSIDSIKDNLDIKKVGPSLVHTNMKLSPAMMSSWIWSPKAFRPTSRMPHYFMLENNSSPTDILRTRTEVAAMTAYLQHTPPPEGTPAYKPEAPPAATGDVKAGKAVFNAVGCLACHTNLNETGEKWITDDLVKRTNASEDEAKKQFAAMDYNQQHWYAAQHLSDKLSLVGPELSGVGTKLLAGRTPEQARAWTYDWVRNPKHYSSYTIMPSLRLSEQEASDLTAYLLSLERPGYEPVDFTKLDDSGKVMLEQLLVSFPDAAGKVTAASSQDEKMIYLGKKIITHYGCNGCHAINGFENATSACANLDEWGLKDPHKLDFGYFDHAFDAQRKQPIKVWKVAHEGTTANAPKITPESASGETPALRQVEISWEEMDLERRPWLYNKLHNTRIYDRGRTMLESSLHTPEQLAGAVKAGSIDLGRPYDKIKMPKFFMTDDQAKAIVTFVTGVRKPLVSDALLARTYTDHALRAARGRQAATVLNCYGCHNIEGNTVTLHQYMDVFADDGTLDVGKLNESAPPRLIGQGSRTQPEWLHSFLRNVSPLRPWLKVRMPSFDWHGEQGELLADGVVDYFAGASSVMSTKLASSIDTVEAYKKRSPDDAEWYKPPVYSDPKKSQKAGVIAASRKLSAFAVHDDLNRAADFDPRQATPEDMRATWNNKVREDGTIEVIGVLDSAKLLSKLNNVKYPFAITPRPNPDAERFARGKALYTELRCFQCHAMGDETKLMASWKATYGDAAAQPEAAPAEEGYGDDAGYGDEAEPAEPVAAGPVYSAPNLAYVSSRLQWNWVHAWLENPATIQPGTKMPQWFPDGMSAFWNRPPEMREELHAKYGYTGQDQIAVLMDFVYAAGLRNYTFYPPDWKIPEGSTAEAVVELKAIAPPPEAAKPADKPGDAAKPEAGKPADGAGTAPAAAKPEVKPVEKAHVVPAHSTIELTDGVTPFTGTRVVGLAKFEGKPARRTPVRMGADAFCAKAHTGSPPLSQNLIVNEDKTLQNAFIYVKSGLPAGQKFEPRGKPEVDQVGCEYFPHVTGMMAGQPIVFVNSDSTLHNVNFSSQSNGRFSDGMPAPGMKITKTFSKPELNMAIKCDVHPWMVGYIHAVPHPFFSTSDVEGRFEITGLPPGKYVLEAIHEDKGIAPVTFEVTVEADKSVRADVTLVRQ